MSPRAVLLKIGITSLNTVRPINTAHPKSAVPSAKSMPRAVNTARSYTRQVNAVRAKGGKPQQDNKGFVDSRCSRHTTGNIAYLLDFKEFDGGYVAFRGGAYGGRITGKGTLKTDSLDFKDVGDEVVHKELGDRMERAATTTSSSEAVQDSVNAVRHMLMLPVQVPAAEEASIRSDLHLEDAEGTDCLPTATIFEELARMGAKSTAWNEVSSTMASLIICLATNQKFNLSKYILDSMVKHLDGGVKFLLYPQFLQVFINQQLGDLSHHKKVYVNPSHTKKFFANMKRAGKDFSGRITPLFDTMMVQASKEVGKDSDYPTDSNKITIVYQLSTSSQPKQKQKSKRRQRKEAEVAHDETEHEESVPTPSNDPLPSGEDIMQLNDLMVLCTKLQTQVLDLEKAKDAQAKEIVDLKKRVKRLERKKKSRTTGLKRLEKVSMSRRVESSEDKESLGDHEDASKLGRRIEDIDADAEVTLVNETQERQEDDLMFDTGVLDDDEVFVDVTTIEKEEQSTKTGEAVTTAGVEDSAAPTIPTTIEETLAHTLMEIKAAKPKAKGIVFHHQEE
ncbi:hypothetical protein Tco_0154553 [Tanacetum coccineum]